MLSINHFKYAESIFLVNEFSQDILKDTSMLEVFDLDVGVQPDLDLKLFSCVSLDLQNFTNLKVTTLQWDVQVFLACQSETLSRLAL